MKFFVDTADVKDIRELNDLGLLDGVTTNPSLILKSGRNIAEVTKEICDIVDGPVSAEVTATDYDEMMKQAAVLAKIADNVCIKVPLTLDGLKACKAIRSDGRLVNVTLCFSANQALLAAKAGASFISPFVGRIDDMGTDGMELIQEIRTIYDNYDFPTEILAASIRTVNHVKLAALIGADVVTVPPATLKALVKHPLTDKGLETFLADWAKTGQTIGYQPQMPVDAEAIAATVLAALDGGRQIAPFTAAMELSVADAYAVTASLRRLRAARGEWPMGRKIGFTNRNIWAEYQVFEPIWGDVYDTTLFDIEPGEKIAVSHLPEPRIEPEIVFGLKRDLHPGMDLDAIAGAIGWVAHGFEIVQSIFPDWRFTVADCIADGGLHGRLFCGPRRTVAEGERADLAARLAGVTIALFRDGAPVDTGTGANVLDGPVQALAHLVEVLGRDPWNGRLGAGELVTTGTVTRAFPVRPGERWETRLDGFDLPGLSVEIG